MWFQPYGFSSIMIILNMCRQQAWIIDKCHEKGRQKQYNNKLLWNVENRSVIFVRQLTYNDIMTAYEEDKAGYIKQ
jgi:hypothetical protein